MVFSQLWKSKDFAARQLFLAKKVGDERLAIKSRIFICLYYISTEQFQVAHDELNSIEKDARAIGDEQVRHKRICLPKMEIKLLHL
jgi:hypothetical protein